MRIWPHYLRLRDKSPMQLSLQDLLREDHILTGLEVADAEQAIRALSRLLEESGHVKASFADEVWKREKDFPTGLPTKPFAVAIPHADPDMVEKSALAIGALAQPVIFHQMGADASQQLSVQLVFLLAIKEAKKQVVLLRELIGVLQKSALLEALMNSSSPYQLYKVLADHLASPPGSER